MGPIASEQCLKCRGLFDPGEVCPGMLCGRCHGGLERLEACRSAKPANVVSILETLEDPARQAPVLEEVASILGRVKKTEPKLSVLGKIRASKRQGKRKGRGDETPWRPVETVRMDSGHPAVTPERVAKGQHRLWRAIRALEGEVAVILGETSRRFGETCTAICAEMPDESFHTMIMRLSVARQNPVMTATFSRVLEDPQPGTTWVGVLLRDGTKAVGVFGIGGDLAANQ